MTQWFCTYFDHRYVPRALLMVRSLARTGADVHVFALCLSDEAAEILRGLNDPRLTAITLSSFERGDHALLTAKTNRSLVEYYFTCTPSLALYVFKEYPHVDLLTYVDADLYFLNSPESLLALPSDVDVTIIAHRYPSRLEASMRKWGIYNVGWLTFRRSEGGFEVLQWWRAKCLEWCYDRAEDGRFADQGYLDDWPDRFPGVRVLTNAGANLAPWNVGRHQLTMGREGLTADGMPVMFFHVHGLKAEKWGFYRTGLSRYGSHLTPLLKKQIYAPYVRELEAMQRLVAELQLREIACDDIRTSTSPAAGWILPIASAALRQELLWPSPRK